MTRSDMRRLVRKAGRALRLPPCELLTTLHAVAILVVVELVIRWVELPRLSRLLGRRGQPPAGTLPRPSSCASKSYPARPRRQLRCTWRVADAWPFSRGPCLRRALVGGHLVRDLHPTIRLGVAGVGDTLVAHAWLEIDGRPLESVSQFSLFQSTSTEVQRVTASEPGVYFQCGLRLRSEVELDLPVVAGDGCDVDIRWGPDIDDSSELPPGDVIASYEDDATTWYTATSTGSGYHLRFSNVGEFVISEDLSEMTVRRDRSGRDELLPILLAGTASAFLLALRGETVLHASAVAIEGSALAFVGQSGRGKSTLAALLCVDGAELVTDDVLAVDPGPPVSCVGGAHEVRLRSAAAVIAETRPDRPTRLTADERLAFTPVPAPLQSLPLSAIIIPSPSRTTTEIAVKVVPPADALFVLLSFPRVHGWRQPDVLRRDFTTLSQLVNLVPVLSVTVPWGPPFDPDVTRSLAALGLRTRERG